MDVENMEPSVIPKRKRKTESKIGDKRARPKPKFVIDEAEEG